MSYDRPALRTTRTYVVCDIVIVSNSHRPDEQRIFAQDFSYECKTVLPKEVGRFLDTKHVRQFNSMNEFTLWLFENSAAVDKCWVV